MHLEMNCHRKNHNLKCTCFNPIFFDYCGAVFPLTHTLTPRRNEQTEAVDTRGVKSIDFRAESAEKASRNRYFIWLFYFS